MFIHAFCIWNIFLVFQDNFKTFYLFNFVKLNFDNKFFSSGFYIFILIIWQIADILVDYDNKLNKINNKESANIIYIHNIFKYINFFKDLFYLVSLFLIIYQRKVIVRDNESSPLLEIGESLTEEFYNKIIMQSKHPEINSIFKEKNFNFLKKKKSDLSDNTENNSISEDKSINNRK